MSLAAINAVLASSLEARLRPLALVLACYADNDGGSIFPSVATLMNDLGRCRRTIQYGLRGLENLNVLVAVGSFRGGRNRSTRYRLNLSLLVGIETQLAPPFPAQQKGANGNGNGRNPRCETAQPTTRKSATSRARSFRTFHDLPGSETGADAPLTYQGKDDYFELAYQALGDAADAADAAGIVVDLDTVPAYFGKRCRGRGVPEDVPPAHAALARCIGAARRSRNGNETYHLGRGKLR